MAAVREHGDLLAALHVVSRPPPEAGPWTLAQLSEFKSATIENVRRALREAFGLDRDRLNLVATLHPCGTYDPTKAGPHFDGFIAGEDLAAIFEPAITAALDAAGASPKERRRARRKAERALLRLFMRNFVGRQAKSVARIVGHPVRLPRSFARWYGEPVALHRALEDAVRGNEFSGWNLDTRLSFAGPWRRLPKVEERARPARGIAGAVPVETVRAGGDWGHLTPEERRFYERIEGEAEARAAVDEEVGATSYTSDKPAAPTPDTIVVDLRGVAPLLIEDPIAPAVRHADRGVEMLLRRIAKLRRELAQRDPFGSHPSIRSELDALARDVQRRRTPSSASAASWLLDALYGAFDRAAPLGISGLLACSELRWLHRQLRDIIR